MKITQRQLREVIRSVLKEEFDMSSGHGSPLTLIDETLEILAEATQDLHDLVESLPEGKTKIRFQDLVSGFQTPIYKPLKAAIDSLTNDYVVTPKNKKLTREN